MKIAVLGTGRVPQTIVPKLVAAGHEIVLGSRTPDTAPDWVAAQPGAIETASHERATSSAELIVNALPGAAAFDALTALSAASFENKVLMDIANAVVPRDDELDLLYPNSSLGEKLQKALPGARVVKTMNTMNTSVMEDPTAFPAATSIFLSGDDDGAKLAVAGLLQDLGWPEASIIDLGGIATARGPEHMFLLLIGLFGALGTMRLNVAVVR
jgi:hypothetical protein